MWNDSDICVKLGNEIDSMISDLDMNIDYNTFSQHVGEVCVRVYQKKLS